MSRRWNVYVTRMLPKPIIDLLKEHCDVELNPYDRSLTREELLKEVRGIDAVLTMVTDAIDAEYLTLPGPTAKYLQTMRLDIIT